ncbi:MAG: hypothetical protein ACQETL_14110 [Bacteroidota bacterium]
MKFYICSVFVLFFSFNSSAQRGNKELDISDNSRDFNSYIDFEVKIVDFENSLYVNDFKTTEFQIENGFHYNINRRFNISLGINGGVILGIPYQDRKEAYINSGNNSGIDTFLKYYYEINFIDQSLAKTRYFIGLHPQVGFNITDKWKINSGTQIRYYFQPFFDGYYLSLKEEEVHFDLLGNLGISYHLNEQLSLGLNYNRGFYNLRYITISSNIASTFTSSVRYHSLGLNVSYLF